MVSIASLLLVAALPCGSEDPAAAAQALFDACAAKDKPAFEARLEPNLNREDSVLMATFYELLTMAPVDVAWPEEPYENGERAIVPVSLRSVLDDASAAATTWLWFARGDQGRWLVQRFDEDPQYSREWVYETPKEGNAASPLEAARTLFSAMEAGERRTAERSSSNLAWEGCDDGLASLYKLTRDLGLTFALEKPRIRGERAIVPLGLDLGGQRQRDALLYLEQRGAGWLATGIDNDPKHADAFLAGGASGTQTPLSPFVALDKFIDALRQGHGVRARNLTTAKFRDASDGLASLLRIRQRGGRVVAASGGVRHEGLRCVARVEVVESRSESGKTLLLLLAMTPEGWRVVGETQVPERADAFLEDQPEAR